MHTFPTSVGTVEIVVHEASRIVSIARLNAEGRPTASTMCDWDTTDLAAAIAGMKVPLSEAREIADDVKVQHLNLVLAPPSAPQPLVAPQPARRLESAGLGRRFAAVLLDSMLFVIPLAVVVATSGGAYAERSDGYASPGARVDTDVQLFLLFLWLCYYVLAEGIFGATLGKRMVGIRVVDEDGGHIGFGAAVVRTLLRFVDALFFCLVGALFALASPRRQRLGDRAAHTVVVRRA